MDHKEELLKIFKRSLSYILVAALASAGTWIAADKLPNSKLEHLAKAIDRRFIGDADQTQIQDAAAEAMIAALGDRWSYYISAEEYADHLERQNNSYVGIGVTVQQRQDGRGIDVVAVEQEGPAAEAGVQAGDIITHADGTPLGELTLAEGRNFIMGEKNTEVVLTLLRGEDIQDVTVTRKVIHSKVAVGQMLSGNVGYIAIRNFHDGAGKETIDEIEKLTEQGAEKLIFDVRNNPGGFASELVDLLDYLLPEGDLFRTVRYDGKEHVDKSDADCLDIPMAVLVNSSSYSAAEFFGAALREYEAAVVVGEQTVGKGYFQTTYRLSDGSAVALSIGKYFTPKGVSLAEQGVTPDVVVPVEDSVASDIYYGLLTPDQDPQIQAAVKALTK